MNSELKKIKKIYGEETMHLCRSLFPTILEHEGLLLSILEEHFAPTKFLATEIKSQNKECNFKNFIYSFIDVESEIITVNKSAEELMKMAGYTLYECHTEEEIQEFKKYYAPREKLCTFDGGRLNTHYVFFAVKDNVDEIKRENFSKPQREDEYGTSVISIQFSRDKANTLSIKNRYNHTVNNPDNTFYNNLDNIISGLTHAFETTYNLNINSNAFNVLELDNFVRGNDRRYYHYNIENNNIYFCENNYIIRNHQIDATYALEKERYILMDTYVLDLSTKKIINLLPKFAGAFDEMLSDIKEITVTRISPKERLIKFVTALYPSIEVMVDQGGNIISFSNADIKSIGKNFLRTNVSLSQINIPNVKQIGSGFLILNEKLSVINLPNVLYIGDSFLAQNKVLAHFNAPELKEIGNDFLCNNVSLESLSLPKLNYIGKAFIAEGDNLKELNVPELQDVSNYFLLRNTTLEKGYFPNLSLNDNGNSMRYFGFLRDNRRLEYLYIPKSDKDTIKRLFQKSPWLLKPYMNSQKYFLEDNTIKESSKQSL